MAEEGRQEPVIGEVKQPEDHRKGRDEAEDDVLLHHPFVDDRGEVGTGAGDGDFRTFPCLVYPYHELAGEGHLLHRQGRLGDHDQEPAVTGEEIRGVRVEIEGPAPLFQAGKHHFPEIEGACGNQSAHPHTELAGKLGPGPVQGALHVRRLKFPEITFNPGRVEKSWGRFGITDKSGKRVGLVRVKNTVGDLFERRHAIHLRAFSRAAKASASGASFSRSPSSRKYASPALPVHSSESRKGEGSAFCGKEFKDIGFEAYCQDGKKGKAKEEGR